MLPPSGKNSYGLVYSGDQRKVLRYPGAAQTTLTGINNEGAIIGTYGPSGNPARSAFVYEFGQFKSINQYGSPTAVPAGISDSRAIVGVYLARGTITYRSVLIVNDVYTDIVVPGSSPAATKVGGINQSGETVGSYQEDSAGYLGFTDLNGTFTTLQVPGAVSTFAYAISNSGNISGVYYDSTSRAHGFVLINGQFKTVDYPGASQTQVLGIDDAGDVVGTYYQGPDCTLPDQNCGFLATAH